MTKLQVMKLFQTAEQNISPVQYTNWRSYNHSSVLGHRWSRMAIMKSKTIALVSAVAVLTSAKASAFSVSTPPGNIVQNGNFQSFFANWSGNIPSILFNWSSAPNDYAALANVAYQDLSTSPGQAYSLSFYAAADLYYGSSVSVNVELNNSPLLLFTTTPHTYNPQVQRYDQMQWQQLTDSFIASSSTTRLEFIVLNAPYFGLSAVSVVPVPESTSFTLMIIGGATTVSYTHLRA